MRNFKTKLESSNDENEYNFCCCENTETIEIGDFYIYFFCGTADVVKCISENEKYEINKNDRVRDKTKIDMVTGFWKNCYKIKSTDFNLESIS